MKTKTIINEQYDKTFDYYCVYFMKTLSENAITIICPAITGISMYCDVLPKREIARNKEKNMNDKLFNNYNFLGAEQEPSTEDQELAVEQNSDEPEAEDKEYGIR